MKVYGLLARISQADRDVLNRNLKPGNAAGLKALWITTWYILLKSDDSPADLLAKATAGLANPERVTLMPVSNELITLNGAKDVFDITD